MVGDDLCRHPINGPQVVGPSGVARRDLNFALGVCLRALVHEHRLCDGPDLGVARSERTRHFVACGEVRGNTYIRPAGAVA